MENETIIALIEGYGAGTLTQEEEISFFQWYSEAGLEKFLELLSQCKNLPGHLSYYPAIPEDFKARLAQDIRNFDADALPDSPHRIPFIRRSRWGWAAAAILILLGTGSYFLFFNRSQKQIVATQQQSFKNDVAPGRTKAVLTLADGSKIILDSAKTGQLAVQGKTTVMNHDGSITYTGKTTLDLLYNTLATGRGEQSPPLTLSDGTKVWLNNASSIRYPVAFTGAERKVEITGEAYFEVATDKNKPFRIDIKGKGEVEVLGTHFNINAYDDEPTINTTLLEGSVKVNAQERDSPESVILKPGQQVQQSKENHLSKLDNVDLDEVVAWKNGSFQFKGASIQTVMRQLSRWYDVEVNYEGAIPEHRFVGKVGRDYNLSEVLAVLGASDVHFKIEGQRIIVRP